MDSTAARKSVSQRLRALDGVVDRLAAGAWVREMGCGQGAATVSMARDYPASRFEGIDSDPGAIEAAWAAAGAAGVEHRVCFHVGDATAGMDGPWDLICFFDAPRDMGDLTVAVIARESLARDGALVAVEPYDPARPEEGRMVKLLGDAGFSRVRLALATDDELVYEARV